MKTMARSRLKKEKDPSLYHLPPQNIEAEQAILSAILIDNNALLDIVEILSPEDFYKAAHQKIFMAIAELFTKSEPVDLVTLAETLINMGCLEDVGGATYLASLVDSVPLAVNPPFYAKIIRDKACLRRLIEKANTITRRCLE
ncbi:MAG: replicative DNA helicase, partial [Deltaproteobacteria bacterium]